MSRTLEQFRWVGGEHDFALNLGEIEILQDKCDAGPEFIFTAIGNGTWRQEYLFETIRLGLIGGGMNSHDARKLVRKVGEREALREFVGTAHMILLAALVGTKDDTPGKDEGEEESPTLDQNSPEESGDSPTSTEAEQP